jgi:hypothetical protein
VSERVALATLAIGAEYAERWHRCAEPGWRAYAAQHGYDVVCIERPLDESSRAAARSPAWQKLLILEQDFAAGYDRVVWVDADVLINPAAPPIVAGIPLERVGAVDEYATPTPELHRRTLEKLYAQWRAAGQPFVDNATAADYYETWGLPGRFDQVVQTGVMVLSPAHHAGLLRDVYDRYEDRGALLNYEMRPLSWELLDADVVSWLDPAFNYVWGSYKGLHFPFLLAHPGHEETAAAARRALADVHFLHFAGISDEMELLVGGERAGEEPRPLRRRFARHEPVRAPVAMAIYRRPDTTARVFERVRAAQPSELLVFANAPRPGDEEEARLCAESRAVITDGIDWDCRLRTRFNDEHLGLREQIAGGLDWVFAQVETAIVLEDDCLPEPSFFAYCDELLERYADDERVFAISGDDFRWRKTPPQHSYEFSRYPLIWGWATWRRAWRHYDADLRAWPSLRASGWLEEFLGDSYAAKYWAHQFDRVEAGLEAWDYVWVLSCWINGGLTAVPTTNLVSNLGFRGDATHTVDHDGRHPFAAMATEPMPWPLRHPSAVTRDEETDGFLEDVVFSGNLRRTFERLRAARGERRALEVRP